MIDITRAIAEKVRDTVDAGLVEGVGVAEPGKMCVEAAVCYALGLPHGDDPGCVAQSLRSLKIRLNDAKWSSPMARAKGLRRLAVAQLGSLGHLDEQVFTQRMATVAIQWAVPLALRAAIKRNPAFAERLEQAAVRCEQEGTRNAAVNAAANAAANVAAYAAANAAANATAYAAANAADAAAYAAANAADAAVYAANAAANTAAYAAAYAAYAANAAANAADAAVYAANAAANTAAYAAAYAAYAANAAANAADAAYAAYAANAAAAIRDHILSTFAEKVIQVLIEMKAPGCEYLDLVPVEEVK